LETRGFNKTVRGNHVEFNVFYQVWKNFRHSVDPCERSKVTRCLATAPITNFEATKERDWVLKDAKDDDIHVYLISDMGTHFKCQEAFPFPVLLVPQIPYSCASSLSNGPPLIKCIHS
jgi:hypothetical protein